MDLPAIAMVEVMAVFWLGVSFGLAPFVIGVACQAAMSQLDRWGE